MKRTILALLMIFTVASFLSSQSNQVSISRVDQMPSMPNPYQMRDWKQVAINYDRFIYDPGLTGDFQPFLKIVDQGENYPENKFFSLPTYVGSIGQTTGEAINILPSLVGATLVGVDKSSQNGYNFILMSQDFFNKANGENLYLNLNATRSGTDWWYDMMPNVFFYQLFDLYPNMGGEAEQQFQLIAENMLDALKTMGGDAAPWSVPFMTYRAWSFTENRPLIEGVPEPEAAGAFAWLLYNAYQVLGEEKYRIGAEWAMEYLVSLNGNPSYELQLPYGTYAAARMNAEIGTKYDVEKLVNWSFDRGNLRGWGTIVDTWNGIDVSGLVGESETATDYAFQLNGIQQAAALVPMVRYEKRFARAIAKWVLNLANANRLFYHSFLPSFLQDGSDWSEQNDPLKVIGYEAIREDFNGLSPFATGDAVKGGWAETNLALYGSSSVGYLGAIVQKTNVEKVLQIDLLKTDFFRNEAYPSFLYYNPYNEEKEVSLAVGASVVDIYDPISESLIHTGVSGEVSLKIPSQEVIMPVIVPASGEVQLKEGQLYINGIIVDYDRSDAEQMSDLRIKALATAKDIYEIDEAFEVYSTIERSGNIQEVMYSWQVNGEVQENTDSILTVMPFEAGEYLIELEISSDQVSDSAHFTVTIVPEIQQAPEIIEIHIEEAYFAPGQQVELEGMATDANGDPLIFVWSVDGGEIVGDSNKAIWTLPLLEGVYEVGLEVIDPEQLKASKTRQILVRDFEQVEGNLIAYYPLAGNGQDFSGNELDGQIVGGVSTEGYDGMPNNAYFFNGTSHHMQVAPKPILNFTDAVTISMWLKPGNLPERESFLVSHGSWQNRYKVSIIPDKRLRWTLNTTSGIKDLDSTAPLVEEEWIHMVATFDGDYMLLYVNGQLEGFTAFGGSIKTTNNPLLLAQSLPDEQEYNFRGTLDEIKIYDFAITPEQAAYLYELGDISSLTDEVNGLELTIFPNPTTSNLELTGKGVEHIDLLMIYDYSGRKIKEFRNFSPNQPIKIENIDPGFYILVACQESNPLKTIKFIKN
ncbi:LamG-like jellyroll fold domain-containing protein [Portibacter marinus]|uniref:LamG-like jellyroll fold domain-containing protein n=1 Tax=Portibacter marinus TaxID=2898660 RepID=UPI001F405E90|nr:LamG-like jellyroll fold domain-containing protein [Portibacter marinus]